MKIFKSIHLIAQYLRFLDALQTPYTRKEVLSKKYDGKKTGV